VIERSVHPVDHSSGAVIGCGTVYVMDNSASTELRSSDMVERHTPWQLPHDSRDAHRIRSSWVSLMNAHAEGLCPLRRTEIRDGYLAMVHEVPARATLLSAIRAKGPLRFGQVAAVGIRIAGALRAMHDERTAHGGVGLESVLVARDGQVWLAGSGLWTLAPNSGGPTACDDVTDLGLLLQALAGDVPLPTAVELLIVRTQDPDPQIRPSLDEVTATLLRPERREASQNPIARQVRSAARAQTPPTSPQKRLTPNRGVGVLGRLRALH
jgi:hypothetical protein